MAKKWYPVIDYLTCAECGACIKKMSHTVSTKQKKRRLPSSPIRMDVFDHCHGLREPVPAGRDYICRRRYGLGTAERKRTRI